MFWFVDVKNDFLKNKKYYFNAFLIDKYFEKQPLPRYQMGSLPDNPSNKLDFDKFCHLEPVYFCILKALLKKIIFFYFNIFVFLDHFDVLISKMNFFKMRKYYFIAFLTDKHFKK
jgi:hypothetical protein